jgi:enoyl-CoA hydratase
MSDSVRFETDEEIAIVTIDRPQLRNAINRATAAMLAASFRRFDEDANLKVAILTGSGSTFCAGFDLKGLALGEGNIVNPQGDGPLGCTRMLLSKPVIAAIEGYAVAGGFELALWCDLRVAARNAVLGVFNRRFGVPLVDGGTVRLARLIGMSRALDLILTGRPISGEDAFRIGLVNRLHEPGRALAAAKELAKGLAALPQRCLRSDRMAVYECFGLPLPQALATEYQHGIKTIESGESLAGARRFAAGEGRHGKF